jgi:peptidoglycan/xylan/chitin deacetylase (PgdA/CDA1 family)
MRDPSDSVKVARSSFMRPPLVLAYHAIGEVPREHDPEGLVISPRELRAQIERLKRREYEFLTMREFGRRLVEGEPLSGVCALTFDDGSLDNGTLLPNILRTLGVPATLYVCPALLGQPHPWVSPATRMRLMDLNELRSASELPVIEIGSHTNSHPDMAAIMDGSEAFGELRSSKLTLEEMIDKPVVSFAYPYGRYSEVCPAAAGRAGYLTAVTCGMNRGGWSQYELQRELIAPGDLPLRFELKIRGLFRGLMSSPPARLRRRLLGRDQPHDPIPARRSVSA